MIRLELLGRIELIAPANPDASALVGRRKRFAMLAHLALAKPGTLRSREAVLALFWPDSNPARAGNSLNQAVHHLRTSLGAATVVTTGDGGVGISPSALWCDAVEFERILPIDPEEALELYRGDLLPGFYVDDAPGFERWLDVERARLRRLARDAAWRLAAEAEAAGETRSATRWAYRSATLSRDDEVAFQQVLGLLHRLGDRAAALHVYEEFAAHLAADLDDEPSDGTRRLMDTILAGDPSATSLADRDSEPPPTRETMVADEGAARAGTRADSTPPVHASEPTPPACHPPVPSGRSSRAAAAGAAAAPSGSNGPARRRFEGGAMRTYLAPLAFAVVALCLSGLVLRADILDERHVPPVSRVRIVVRDFSDASATSRRGSIAPVLTAGVLDDLATVRSFDVVPPTFRDERTGQRRRAVGQARFVVTGSILSSAERPRVSASLADAVTGSIIGTATFEHDPRDSTEPVGSLSRDISSMVRVSIGRELRTRDLSSSSVDRRALRLTEEALAERERARGLERGGRLPGAVRVLLRADSLLANAVSMEPRWKEPAIERARIAWEMAALHLTSRSRDTLRADALLRDGIARAERAVASDRRDAAALETLGRISFWYWLQAPLAADSARAVLAYARNTLRSAVAIDPERASAWSLLSAVLYTQADFSGSYLAADRAYRADAFLEDAREILGRLFMAAYEVGDDAAARRWCDEINRRFRGGWTGSYCSLGLLAWPGADSDSGNPGQAWAIVGDGAAQTSQPAVMRPRLAMLVAAVLARAGLRDSAEAVILSARSSAAGDPEMLPLEASARIVLGQPDSAIACLARYVQAKPLHRAAVACSRRFAGLRASHRGSGLFGSCGR